MKKELGVEVWESSIYHHMPKIGRNLLKYFPQHCNRAGAIIIEVCFPLLKMANMHTLFRVHCSVVMYFDVYCHNFFVAL